MGTENPQLGKTAEAIDVDTREQHKRYSTNMVSQARHSVDIASRQLDPYVYDQQEFIDALTKSLLAQQKMQVRILVHEARAITRRGHRLVTLAQRLPTFIKLRVPGPEFRDYSQGLLLVDEQGYIFREQHDRYEGLVDFCEPSQVRFYTRKFDKMWDTATPDANLRRMTL